MRKNIWNFNNIDSSLVKNPTKSFNTAGKKTIWLYTTTNRGCKDTGSIDVLVRYQAQLIVDINNDTQCLKGNSVVFTNKSTIVGDSLISFKWTFGDGNTSNQQNPLHNYTQPGIYTVTLTVTDEDGNITGTTDFLSGFLDGQKSWGRPSAPLALRDGSLLVSDDKHNAIYRITYKK